MSQGSGLLLDQSARRATGRVQWFETAICSRFWLRVSLHGVPELPVSSSESRADSPLLSMLEVARTQLQLFCALCRRQPRVTSSRPRIIAWLPDYPAGRVQESSGVIKGLSSSIETKLSKRTWTSCIRSLHGIAQSSCRLGHESQRFSGRLAPRTGGLTADQPTVLSDPHKINLVGYPFHSPSLTGPPHIVVSV
jgi:hypothetical protein